MTTLSDAELLELLGPDPAPAPKDWKHQAEEFKRNREKRARVLLWSMRTGKSKAVIDKACYQFGQKRIEGVIILAPNGIHLNWLINEVPKWSWPEIGPFKTFGWSTPKRADWEQIDAFNALCRHGGMKWMAINMEAISHPDCVAAIRKFKLACGDKFMLAVSEAHHFGHAGTKRTTMARNLARRAKYVTLETGTAILNSPLRAYSIYKILADDALGKRWIGRCYEKFVQYFANIEIEQRGKGRRKNYKKIESYKNLDELRDLMAPWSSVVLRSDVEDMPPLVQSERIIVMSEKQRRAYLEMVSRHLVEIGDDMVTAKDGGARVQKLQQILNGYVKDGDDIREIDPDAPIYGALVEEVYGTLPGKTMVWCRYREDIRRCVAKLKHEGFKVLEFHGGIPVEKREGIRLAFQNDPRFTVCVGQPGAGGEGRDFSAADTIIFFSSTPNAIHVEQAQERGTQKAGHSVSVIRIRTPGTVDDRNWSIVDGKVSLADTVSGRGLRDLLMRTDV